MNEIGILSVTGTKESPYIEAAKRQDFYVHKLSIEQLEEAPQKVQVLLLDGSQKTSVENHYEMILKVRKLFTGYLIYVTQNQYKVNDLIYLKLGVTRLISGDTDCEVALVQEKKLLEHIAQLKESSTCYCSKKNNESKASLLLRESDRSLLKDNSERINLTVNEYRLLYYLMSRAGKEITYEELASALWGSEGLKKKHMQSLLGNIVHHIRTKLNKEVGDIAYIQTIRSKGYQIDPKVQVVIEAL